MLKRMNSDGKPGEQSPQHALWKSKPEYRKKISGCIYHMDAMTIKTA